jgi:hypothetical protein
MRSRDRAEQLRSEYFDRLVARAAVTDAATKSAALDLVVKHLLEHQLAYFARRGKRHEAAAGQWLRWAAFASGIASVRVAAGGMAGAVGIYCCHNAARLRRAAHRVKGNTRRAGRAFGFVSPYPSRRRHTACGRDAADPNRSERGTPEIEYDTACSASHPAGFGQRGRGRPGNAIEALRIVTRRRSAGPWEGSWRAIGRGSPNGAA